MKNKGRNEKSHERKPVRQTEKTPKTAERKKTPAIKKPVATLGASSMASILAERIAGIL
jgi:hypothetical protein